MKKLIPIILVIVAFAFSACDPNQTSTVGIRVVDSNDVSVGAGYMVVFRNNRNLQPPGNNPDYNVQLATDANGKVIASFALPAIIEANVFAPGQTDFSIGNELAWVPVKLEPGETVSYKIVLPQ